VKPRNLTSITLFICPDPLCVEVILQACNKLIAQHVSVVHLLSDFFAIYFLIEYTNVTVVNRYHRCLTRCLTFPKVVPSGAGTNFKVCGIRRAQSP